MVMTANAASNLLCCSHSLEAKSFEYSFVLQFKKRVIWKINHLAICYKAVPLTNIFHRAVSKVQTNIELFRFKEDGRYVKEKVLTRCGISVIY